MENISTKNIKIGAIITYLTQFLSIAISFIYVPIMLGKLGQSEYGLYSIVQSLISYLHMSEMGIGTTATRYNAKYIGEKDEHGQRKINGMFFKMYLGIAAVCAAVAFVLYFLLDVIYKDYSQESIDLIKTLFVIAVVNLIITFVFQIFNAIIIAYEDYIFLKTLSLVQTLLGPISMVCVLYMGYRSIGMLCVTTVINLVFGLIQMSFCLKKHKIRFDFKKVDKKIFKTILSFTIFVFINSLASSMMINADKIVVSIIMTETAVATLAVVMQFHTYSYNFSNVLSGFFLPHFTKRLAKKEVSNEVFADLCKTGRVQIFISGLIFGGFLAIGRPFIYRWIGTDYDEVYLLTVIVLFSEVIGAAQSMFNPLMQAMNLHKLRAILSLFASTFKIGLTIIFTYHFGLLGCATAFLIGFLIRHVVFNIYYKKRAGIKVGAFWLDMLKIFVPQAFAITILYFATSLVLKYIPATSYPLLIAYALVYTLLYSVAVGWAALTKEEKHRLFQRFHKR